MSVYKTIFSKLKIKSLLGKQNASAQEGSRHISSIFAVEIMGKDKQVFIFHHGVRYLLSADEKQGLVLRK